MRRSSRILAGAETAEQLRAKQRVWPKGTAPALQGALGSGSDASLRMLRDPKESSLLT